MIDRYVYAVTKELPEKSRKEITNELNALIEDMMDGMDENLAETEKIDKVLRELGNPRDLANSYRGKERYLIGPNYYDKYIFVLKIVALSVFIGLSVAWGVSSVFSVERVTEMIPGYLSSLLSAILQGAAWVTLVFFIIENKEISFTTGLEEKEWKPSQLPVLPKKKALISRGESVFAIIINTVFLPLIIVLPDKIGLYYTVNSDIGFIPLFSLEGIDSFKIVVFIVFMINILIELIKIIKGRWTKKVAFVTTGLNILSAVLFISVISNMKIWSDEIVQKFEQFVPISFERAILIVIAMIVIIIVAESISAIYKGVKHGGMD